MLRGVMCFFKRDKYFRSAYYLLESILNFCVCLETMIAIIEIIVAERPKAIPIIASLDIAAAIGQKAEFIWRLDSEDLPIPLLNVIVCDGL